MVATAKRKKLDKPVATPAPADSPRMPVFEMEILKALEVRLREQNVTNRDLIEMLREVRGALHDLHEMATQQRDLLETTREMLHVVRSMRDQMKKRNR